MNIGMYFTLLLASPFLITPTISAEKNAVIVREVNANIVNEPEEIPVPDKDIDAKGPTPLGISVFNANFCTTPKN